MYVASTRSRYGSTFSQKLCVGIDMYATTFLTSLRCSRSATCCRDMGVYGHFIFSRAGMILV